MRTNVLNERQTMHVGHSLVRSLVSPRYVIPLCIYTFLKTEEKRKENVRNTKSKRIEVLRRDRGDANKGYENVILLMKT